VTTSCLIVDDSKQFLVAARHLLERQGLTVVGVASTSAEALQQVQSLRPEVVLVDVSLGEESGLELARRLIEDDHGGSAAVIMISTRSGEDVADLVAQRRLAFLPKSDLSADAILRLVDGQPD
jgi:DNA-binding NarL/FixJ family response regulator